MFTILFKRISTFEDPFLLKKDFIVKQLKDKPRFLSIFLCFFFIYFKTPPLSTIPRHTHQTQYRENVSKLDVKIKNPNHTRTGPGGRSLIEIQHISGANIQISKKGTFAPGTRNRIVTISGAPQAINTAHFLIEQRINEEETKRACQTKVTNATTAAAGVLQ